MLPWRFSRTWFASQPTASKSGERYSVMPSSKLSRSPARTLSAIGFNRRSLIVSSLISNLSKISNAPNGRRRAPEQQEQHTNIAVHGEKRSVQLAQVVRFDKGMLVSQQSGDNRDARPCRPWQSKADRQPAEKRNHADVHPPCDQQRLGNTEFLGHGEKPRAPIVVNILARVEHVKRANPERNCRAKNEHARIEASRNGDPSGGRRNAQREAKEQVRPICEALGERIEKENGDRQRRQFQSEQIQLPCCNEKYRHGDDREKPREL